MTRSPGPARTKLRNSYELGFPVLDHHEFTAALNRLESFVNEQLLSGGLAVPEREKALRLHRFRQAELLEPMRDAVAFVAARRRLRWNTQSDAWSPLIQIAFPGISDRRVADLGYILEHLAKAEPSNPEAIIDGYGGVYEMTRELARRRIRSGPLTKRRV